MKDCEPTQQNTATSRKDCDLNSKRQQKTAKDSKTQQNTAKHAAQHSTAAQNTAQQRRTQQNTAQHSRTQHNSAEHSRTQQNTAEHSRTQQNTAKRHGANFHQVQNVDAKKKSTRKTPKIAAVMHFCGGMSVTGSSNLEISTRNHSAQYLARIDKLQKAPKSTKVNLLRYQGYLR